MKDTLAPCMKRVSSERGPTANTIRYIPLIGVHPIMHLMHPNFECIYITYWFWQSEHFSAPATAHTCSPNTNTHHNHQRETPHIHTGQIAPSQANTPVLYNYRP